MNLANFPNLLTEEFTYTSDVDPSYNCIACAAGDTVRNWWPGSLFGYWPPGVPETETLDTFVAAFGTLGYVPCDTPDFEAGYEKVALYAMPDGTPTHAARRISATAWISKIGENEDIEHSTLDGLVGPLYGTVARFLKRSMSQPSAR